MSRMVLQPPPWEHRINTTDGITEDMWFGTYWFHDGAGDMHGPHNTIAEAQNARDGLAVPRQDDR